MASMAYPMVGQVGRVPPESVGGGMRRRDFLTLAGAVAWPLAVRAQQSDIPVIGYLSETTFSAQINAAFLRGMAALGYVEGKNFAIEYRYKPQSLPDAAADL